MSAPPEDSLIQLLLPAAAASSKQRRATESARVAMNLFDQLQPRLSSYVMAFGLSAHDAEDIVQETFLSLFHHLERDRPRWNLHGWLFRVAHNLALKQRMANRFLASGLDDEASLDQHPDPRGNAEEQMVFSQTRERLLAVFAALPELDRQCLHLRAGGLKYREIAKILGISLGSVSASLSRSLARMSRATGGGGR
jgi:RNA polymerase sigma-70 factor (ECF subfamily)